MTAAAHPIRTLWMMTRLSRALALAFAAVLPLAAQEAAKPDASRLRLETDSLTVIQSFQGRDDTVATMVQRGAALRRGPVGPADPGLA